MSEKVKPARDAFTFSLGGMSATTSFVVAPAVADDRFNELGGMRPSKLQEDQPVQPEDYPGIKGRYWLLGRRRAA